MLNIAREQLEMRGLDDLFSDKGNGEIVIAWNKRDVWFRQMIDWLSWDGRIFCDKAKQPLAEVTLRDTQNGAATVIKHPSSRWPRRAASRLRFRSGCG